MLVNAHGRPVTSTRRTIAVRDPRLFEYLSWGDPLLSNHALTLVCQHCGGTPTGTNHEHDAVWVLECGCSRWEWRRAAGRKPS